MVEFCHSLNSRSVKICMVTPGLSLCMQCSYSCSFPGVLGCPQAVTCSVCRVQLSTSTCGTIQCTNKSQPWLGREMQSCSNSSTNMNNNNFSNYFPPFLFSVRATCVSGGHVWRDCSKFISLGLFSEMQLLRRTDFRFCAVGAMWLLHHQWIFISDWLSLTWHDDVSCWGWIQLWLGPMATQLFHCPTAAWLCMCSLVCQREEMGLTTKEMPSRKLEI